MKDALKDIIEDWLTSMDDNTRHIKTILTEDWFKAGNDWYDFAVGVQGIIETIALLIITLIFLVEFLKITIRMDVLKWEFLLKCFFKLVFAKVCIDISADLLSAIYTTGVEWIDGVSNRGGDAGALIWDAVETKISGMGMLALLGFFISSGIMFLVMWVISLVVEVIAYARKFELTIYTAIAPLPCAFLPSEDGGNRIAKKFFLSFSAICLQGMFMMMSLKLHGLLIEKTIEKAIDRGEPLTTVIGEALLCTIVMVMAVIKSGGWAKNVLDVAG